jgi:hydrogenase/urease accessory protein HupE
MYQPYPGGTQLPEDSRPAPPKPVSRAALLMYAGAVASLAGVVIDVLSRGAIRSDLHTRNHDLTPSQLTTDAHAVLGGLIISALIAVGLWIWMALSCKAGKEWARTVSGVLFAIATIELILSGVLPSSGWARIYGLVVWLIGLAAILQLWRPESTAYFKGGPRY